MSIRDSMNYDFLLDSVIHLKEADSVKSLKEKFVLLIYSLGFQQFIYIRFMADDINPEQTIYTYSEAWTIVYLENNYQHIDPIFVQAFSSPEPFFWSAKHYEKDPELRDFFAEANQYGIYQGVSVPLKAVAKKRAVLTCAAAQTEKDLPIAQDRKGLMIMRALAETFHQKAIEFSTVHDYHLKPRERQMLNLSALGFTSEEAAEILDLNKDYVHEIIANTLNRLGVRSRLCAYARAQELNLLKNAKK